MKKNSVFMFEIFLISAEILRMSFNKSFIPVFVGFRMNESKDQKLVVHI